MCHDVVSTVRPGAGGHCSDLFVCVMLFFFVLSCSHVVLCVSHDFVVSMFLHRSAIIWPGAGGHLADSHCLYVSCSSLYASPCSGELRMQRLKPHLVRTQSLNFLPLKPGVGQYIALHAMLTARDFFLACFCPYGPFHSPAFFSKTSHDFSCVGSG